MKEYEGAVWRAADYQRVDISIVILESLLLEAYLLVGVVVCFVGQPLWRCHCGQFNVNIKLSSETATV